MEKYLNVILGSIVVLFVVGFVALIMVLKGMY